MTPQKIKQRLAGQTSIAQKVFGYVPINEAWAPIRIHQALSRDTGRTVDMHIFRGCLSALADAGLIRACPGALYQRDPINTKEPEAMPATLRPVISEPAKVVPQKAAVSAIDLLAGVAKTLRGVADEIEAAALAIEEDKAKAGEDVAKLRQLQALLKGLA